VGGVLQVALFDVLRTLGTWRWLLVPPVFFVAGWLGAENAEYDYAKQELRTANFWDGPLTMMTDNSVIIFAFVFGYSIVTGDIYVRDRYSGTATMTLLRSRSRTSWWISKICALGPLALVFSLLAFLSALVASALQLPISLGWSPASRIPWGSESAIYPSFESMPAPLFLLIIALYTAPVLWVIGSIILCASVFYPRLVTPLIVGLVWALVGTPLVAPLYSREGAGILDPAYHLSYVIHFGHDRGFVATPWYFSFLLIIATLGLAMAIGALWLRRVDL
jgi:hypothetical protein